MNKQGYRGIVYSGIPPDEFLFGDDINIDKMDFQGATGSRIMKEFNKQNRKANKSQPRKGLYSANMSD